MDEFGILRYRVLSRKEAQMMMNMDIFQLFFNYLEERLYSKIYQNMKQDDERNRTQSAIQRIGFIGRTEKNHNTVD